VKGIPPGPRGRGLGQGVNPPAPVSALPSLFFEPLNAAVIGTPRLVGEDRKGLDDQLVLLQAKGQVSDFEPGVPGRKPVRQLPGPGVAPQESEAGLAPRDFAAAPRPPGLDRPGAIPLCHRQPLEPARILVDVDPPAEEPFLGRRWRWLLPRTGTEPQEGPQCNNHDAEPHGQTSRQARPALGLPRTPLTP